MPSDLERCPFCAGSDLDFLLRNDEDPPAYVVWCKSCGALGPTAELGWSGSWSDASADKWNARPELAAAIEDLERYQANLTAEANARIAAERIVLAMLDASGGSVTIPRNSLIKVGRGQTVERIEDLDGSIEFRLVAGDRTT